MGTNVKWEADERGTLVQLYTTIRRSFLLTVATFGVLVALVGYLLLENTLAAFFVIWGVTFILFGFGSYALLVVNRELF